MELRVFISSTFTDLEDERQHLAKKVFPAIRQLCRERGVEFTEIDLRWGLTEEEARLGKVIRTCMEEIDRCRPYFIGLLGSRYGWVPKFHEIQRDPELLRNYPWIEDAVLEGKSLVEMEFEYGALSDPAKAHYAHFYTRRARAQHQKIFTNITVGEAEKLVVLRERILKSGLPFHEFSGPESLGEQIYDDLLNIIEERWKPKEEITPLERERREHEGFASTRRHAYIANPAYIRALTEAMRESHSVVIYAPSGSGKSALAAYWSRLTREKNPQMFVIEHYIGIGSAADHFGPLWHIFAEIKDRLSLEDEIPSEPERLASELPQWLARLGDIKTVIILDALNQLEERSQHLGWLPEHLPENVSVVASTTSQTMWDTLTKRGYEGLQLAPLESGEREAIVVRFLSEYHKALGGEDLKRISQDPKSASPLFLRTMLEEVRVTGNFEHLDKLIERYLSSTDIDDLFQKVLERLEEDYGPRTVREVMGFVWASRKGLSENELAELMPVTRLRLSSFLMALDYHLHRRDGRLTFFHEYLQHAVESRYTANVQTKKHLHEHLARYLRTLPPSSRRAEEEPWQWEQAEGWEELRNTLVDLDLFTFLFTKEKQYELLGYWRKLKGKYNLVEEYEKKLQEVGEQKESLEYVRGVYHRLADLFNISGQYRESEKLLLQAVEYSRLLNLSQNAIAEEKEQLAEVYYYQSSYEKAKTLYNEVRSLYLTYNGDSDKKTLAANVSYGTLCVLCQDVEGGINILEKTYDMYMTYYTDSYTELISVLNNLGYAYNVRREYGKAIEYTEKCLRLIEGKDGIRNPSLITSLVNLGTYYRRSGLIEKAEQCYERALSISLQNLGYSHPKTAYVLFNQGSLEYFARQNFEKSKTLCKAAFEIRKKTLGLGHADTLFVLTFLGNEATNEGMKELAVELVQHSLREIEHEVPAPTELISILREYNLSFSQQLEKERGAKLS